MHMRKDKKRETNRGFTLVELIVVIVILAILAAILVPALLGYIDKAKGSQDILAAKNIMNAAQTKFVDAYVAGQWVKDYADASTGGKGKDVYLYKTTVGKEILDTADDHPYMVIVGAGKYDTYGKSSNPSVKHKAYTIYFVAYWKTKDSKPVFFNGSEWSTKYPWKTDGDNNFTVNGETMTIENYILAAPEGNIDDAWRALIAKSDK